MFILFNYQNTANRTFSWSVCSKGLIAFIPIMFGSLSIQEPQYMLCGQMSLCQNNKNTLV